MNEPNHKQDKMETIARTGKVLITCACGQGHYCKDEDQARKWIGAHLNLGMDIEGVTHVG